MTNNYKSYIFNFSNSFFGGGLKRIMAYLQWFNDHGGANFVLNSKLKGIEAKFPINRYCFLEQNPLAKVINYSNKLNKFIDATGDIDLYYSYGIPLPYKAARVNWMHVANVLTFVNPRKYVSFRRSLELRLLGILIRNSIKHADIISAESEASLDLLGDPHQVKLVVSVNGSDEEILQHQLQSANHIKNENIAVAVGTCQYKCIDDVYKIYLNLRQSNPDLRLVIAGIEKDVPDDVKNDPLVVLRGVLSQSDVCDLLTQAKYYITATLIENSYNAASEGAFLAKEAFVSDIGPHRELLTNVKHKRISHLGTRAASLCVDREDMIIKNLKSWDQVIKAMISTTQEYLKNT